MQPGLIIVSNRLPVSVKKVDGKLVFYPSIGGLATGLASYATDSKNKWIGWPGIASDELTERERRQISDRLRMSNCYPVFLTQRQLDDYYNGYSNSVLWPLFHGNEISAETRAKQKAMWQSYQRVNQTFADAVLALSTAGTTVWVHDYQLLILPALLRLERPSDQIGFFLHIPFPDIENFRLLEEAEALLAGMLGADLVGLHTESYVNNFLDASRVFDTGITEHKKVILPERVVRVTDFPMGIDYDKYEKARKSRAVLREYAKLRLKYHGQKVILTVDRLDPSKGLVERAQAYYTFLQQNPKLKGKVTMIMLVVPSRTDIAEYQALQKKLEKIIKDTNREFGTKDWRPVVFMFTALPFEQVTALYRRADVAFIAPLRDGMNLVAKEYLASKPSQRGVLILSKTAGAAEELKGAVMVDPSKPATLVTGLTRALAMPTKDLKRRVKRMQKHLQTSTVQVWAGNFMKTLKKESRLRPTHTQSLAAKHQAELLHSYKQAKSRLLLLDYDGVLMNFHKKFEEAQPTDKLSHLLKALSRHARVVVISGRPKRDLDEWFKDTQLTLVAEHGAFWRDGGRGTSWHTSKNVTTRGWQQQVKPILEKYAARTPGAFVEAKQQSLVWHYRQATSPYYAQKHLVTLKRILKPLARDLGLQVQQGNMILEVRPDGVDKGTTADHWLKEQPEFVLAIGDDYTDEDTFHAMPPRAYTVKVGHGRTDARYRLKSVEAVLRLLEKLSKS